MLGPPRHLPRVACQPSIQSGGCLSWSEARAFCYPRQSASSLCIQCLGVGPSNSSTCACHNPAAKSVAQYLQIAFRLRTNRPWDLRGHAPTLPAVNPFVRLRFHRCTYDSSTHFSRADRRHGYGWLRVAGKTRLARSRLKPIPTAQGRAI